MTNFDYLKEESQYSAFSNVAISAERIILADPQASIINSRRAMEFAVKWIYSVDKRLEPPYQETLVSLMGAEDFRQFVGNDIYRRMDYIRRCGNDTAHTSKNLGFKEAMLCLENLSIFLDYVACCYSKPYTKHIFDKDIILNRKEKIKKSREENRAVKEQLEAKEIDLQALIKENADLREQLSARSEVQKDLYVPSPLEKTEYETRKLYIDEMLRDAGWIKDKDWVDEVGVDGMPGRSGKGRADYVLYDDMLKPLAIVEAKKTCEDLSVGRIQAKLYADYFEEKYGRRPVIFLTNGFETRIIDGQYPERICSQIYSKRDLEKWFNLMSMRTSLKYVSVDKEIAGRYYQEEAVKRVCESFDEKNRRKALLVMATGSGKTRTVIALCKILLNAGWVKNILFLADRNSLVVQAKRNFVNLLPKLSCTNLVEEKDNYNARCVFSTYQTMINKIDSVKDEYGKIFSCGHFDLIVCDEAHRSIYNKYKDIFNYFDAPLVGLTATPKDEIDKNTYDIFELEKGVPTYGYDLAQAVKDEYLVSYMTVETTLKIPEDGLEYDNLPDDEKEQYEDTFTDDNGDMPERIAPSAINSWVFNDDTIKVVLDILMDKGIKVDYGQRLGKTIIFAKNHNHAEKIYEIFNKRYPDLNGFAQVIDNKVKFSQSMIDDFSDSKKMPQIAISVDMLDTGIDVPEVVNLVFFKKVMSKAKFWQMIGRGTRLCPGLLDGEDKEKFYIFDFCGNFEFFRMNKGRPTANMIALQGAIFQLEFEIAYKLQDIAYQTERLIAYRNTLVEHMASKVKELNRENFAVRQHLKYVDTYANEKNYTALTYEDTLVVREELSPLIEPENDNATALRFDALMYGIELAYLIGKKYSRGMHDLISKVSALSSVSNIPEIMVQADLINQILHTDYLDNAGINEFEYIRENLRDLMKYIPKGPKVIYETNFDDEILSMDWKESELENDDLKNYKAKAEYFVRQHQDNEVIAKLKSNKPLTSADIKILEEILWSEVGTKQDYEAEYGEKPLGEFVREIVGLDMAAAKEAFAEYLDETNLNSRQIYFVNQIVEFIVHNGMMKDLSVLQEAPFTDQGSIVEVFTDLSVWMGIRRVIEQVNANALAA